MAKPDFIELPDCEPIPILYEDRATLAIDKPRGKHLPEWRNNLYDIPMKFRVHVEPDEPVDEQTPTLFECLKDFDGMAGDLPSDLAANLDHYVHGHSRP